MSLVRMVPSSAMITIIAACALIGACGLDSYQLGGGSGTGSGDAGNGAGDGNTGDGNAGVDAASTCIPIGPDDTCDGIDNDCNGVVDDPFDLQNDGENCGACGVVCVAAGAIMACEQGACEVVACQPGFKDLDPLIPGCEYRCPLFPEQPEDCNGVDDDCDGVADEPVDLPAPPAGLCRETPGTPCQGVSMVCDTRGTPPVTRWYCAYPAEVEFDPTVPNGILLDETLCDGQDGDCDGVADDVFSDLGQECDNGEFGSCRDVGVRSCDPNDNTATYCDLTALPDSMGGPFPETCNGVDDNCDGVVDNPELVADDMAHITHSGLDFYIYRYEAARPDATAMDPGTSDARTCSKPGVVPWSGVTFGAAQTACAASGRRLCTSAEYLAACSGLAGTRFPYGDTFDPDVCNTESFDGIGGGDDDDILLPTGDALLAACVSADMVSDLSGNLKEWTDDITGQSPGGVDIAVLRGGAYDTPEAGATCDFRISRAAVDTVLPTIGFRCCSDTP